MIRMKLIEEQLRRFDVDVRIDEPGHDVVAGQVVLGPVRAGRKRDRRTAQGGYPLALGTQPAVLDDTVGQDEAGVAKYWHRGYLASDGGPERRRALRNGPDWYRP